MSGKLIILLHTSSYPSGSTPNLFWLAFSLLIPLAGLVRFQLTQDAPAAVRQRQPARMSSTPPLGVKTS